MKHYLSAALLSAAIFVSVPCLYAQENTQDCKVDMEKLTGSYLGECKNGWAHGKGEAKGAHQYKGNFKNGLPNGEGTYYYGSSLYHTGKFQAGIREGKGEMHYLRVGKPDSVIKGYWSGDEYRGKSYVTYNFMGGGPQMSKEIEPIDGEGNTVEVFMRQESGAGSRYYALSEIISLDGSVIRKLPHNRGIYRLYYAIDHFPVTLQIMFTDGSSTKIELYKKAKWSIRLLVVQ